MSDKVFIQQSIFWAGGRLIDRAERERESLKKGYGGCVTLDISPVPQHAPPINFFDVSVRQVKKLMTCRTDTAKLF
jgi:hypothetical protein